MQPSNRVLQAISGFHSITLPKKAHGSNLKVAGFLAGCRHFTVNPRTAGLPLILSVFKLCVIAY